MLIRLTTPKHPMMPLLDTVLQHLRQLESQGQTHVRLDDSAIQLLRQFHRLRAPQRQISEAPQTKAAKSISAPRSTPTPDRDVPAPPLAAVPPIVIKGENKTEQLLSLQQQAQRWPQLHGLKSLRTTAVWGQGNADAEILFVYESPTFHDENQRAPLGSMTGDLFDRIMTTMGTTRAQQFITPLVKFRPDAKGQTTNTRGAVPEEVAAFLPLFIEELRIIQPRVIVALGALTAQWLLKSKNAGQLRGSWQDFAGIPLCITEHPSMLLGGNHEIKRRFWVDILAVMTQLGWPISEKQQRFFLPSSSSTHGA